MGHAAGRPELCAQHGLHRLGCLRRGTGRAIRSSTRRPGAPPRISGARTSRFGARPIPPASSPTATATSTSPNGWRPATTRPSSRAIWRPSPTLQSPQCGNRAAHSGHLPVLQRGRGRASPIYAGQFDAQTGADNIAAAWERITDQIGREQQIALKASLGVSAALPRARLAGVAAGRAVRPGGNLKDGRVSNWKATSCTSSERESCRLAGGWLAGDPARRLAALAAVLLVQILDKSGSMTRLGSRPGARCSTPSVWAPCSAPRSRCFAARWACARCSCCRPCCSRSRW